MKAFSDSIDTPNQDLKWKWKGTIGIISLNPIEAANLNKGIIDYGNSIGLVDDQHFPEILAVGIKSGDIRHLADQAKLCYDFGCDVVAIAQTIGETKLNEDLAKNISPVPVFAIKTNPKDFAKELCDHVIKLSKTRRPNLIFDLQSTNEKEIRANLEEDKESRTKRINQSKKYNRRSPYATLQDGFVGVIGGAGPLASADFCFKLAQDKTPFVHYSVNSAPGKHRFETEGGPSYIQHYENAVDFFDSINATNLAIPCNTAHRRLKEFCHDSLEKVVDIRQSVFETNKNSEGFILLGTNATTGVGLDSGKIGTYEKLRSEKYSKVKEFVVPNEENQAKIMDAIYDVKAGDFTVAKEKIMSVITEIRKIHGNLPVILGCTELPLANFVELELRNLNLIDPSEALSLEVKEQIQSNCQPENYHTNRVTRERGRERKRPRSDSSSSSSYNSNSSSSDSGQENQNSKDVDGVSMQIYCDHKNDYRIAITGKESSEKFKADKAKTLSNLKDKLYQDVEKNENSSSYLDRVHGPSYVSFHNPKGKLLENIKKFIEDHKFEVINGKPNQSKQR